MVYMHAQSNLDAEREVLRKIQRTAVAILDESNADSHISKPTPVLDTSSILDTSSMALDLTFPHDIIAPIMKLPEGIRQKVLGCFTNRVNEIQELFLSFFRSVCSMARNANDLDAIRQGLRNVYYRRCISLMQVQLSRLPDISKHQPKNRSAKRTFNNEYTPLLEEYFKHNAYPCASDRLILARKTMMTPRQIEVWFQNHRNRAKKEGKSIKRSSSNQALELSLKSLETDTSLFTGSQLASSEDSSSEDGVIEDSVSQSSVDVFGCPAAPPHAFPTPYPHNCANPFPNDNGIFRFAPPVWRRRPAAAANLPPSAPINLDEFVAMFTSKLKLEDGLSTVQSRRKTSLSKPWFAATVTIASPAPHPALLRRSCVTPLLQTIAPPTSVIQTSLRSRSSSVTPVSPPLSQIASIPKKLAPLPRRTPTVTSSRSTLLSSSSLTDPVLSPLPVIQAQAPVITHDMFEAFHKYINTKLQPRWNNPDPTSSAHDRHGSPFSPYQSTTLLPITNLNYLEVQS